MSKTRISRLFTNTSFYVLASLLQSGASFFLIPFYTRSMSKAEFGASDQIIQAITLLGLVASFGLPLGLARGIYLEGNDPTGQKKMIGALCTFIFSITVSVCTLLFFLRDALAPLLFGHDFNIQWFTLGILMFLVSSLQAIPLLVYRTLQKASLTTLWSLCLFVINATGSVALVVYFHMGLTGMLLANLIGYSVIMFAQVPQFSRYCSLNFNFKRLAPLFAFGLPILPNLAARNILETANRYILPYYHGLAELGTLTMASKVSGIINTLILTPFMFASLPFIYSRSMDSDAPKLFGRLTYYITILLSIMFICIEAFKSTIVAILGGTQYADATPVITIIMIGILCSGLQNLVAAGIHIKKKIPQEAAIMVGSSCISVLANFAFIPHFKSLGAAMAVTTGFLCFLVGTFFLAQKYYPVPYPFKKIFRTLILLAVCIVTMNFLKIDLIGYLLIPGFIGFLLIADRSLVNDVHSLITQILSAKQKKNINNQENG
jgi:O-antigen/teichoic acid export membrane protein